MIHGVYANQSSFHSVQFTAGLNVILAERTDASTQKDTRNGLGKSTLIEIIHFCLGSSGKSLRIDPLKDWAFTVDVTLAGNRIRATRAVESPNRIIIDGPTTGWIEQPDLDKKTGELIINLERWKTILGWGLFGLADLHKTCKYAPSYRSLISYFARNGSDAYSDPFRHFRQQATWDIQLHIAFLLGLNWEYAARWQELKDQQQALEAMERAIKTGAIESTLGSVGELEAERVQLEGQIDSEQAALASFRVHPQYETIQQDADRVTAIIHELTNQNVTDRRRLTLYMESTAAERPPSDSSVERLYEEAGLVFPEGIRRTLAEAKEFHHKIVANRKAFLDAEIQRLGRQIQDRDERIRELTAVRAASLDVLRTHGALQELTALQERHVQLKGRLQHVIVRLSEIKELTSRKRDIKMAKTELAKRAELDHGQRRDLWAAAVRLFNGNSESLYKTPGSLVIDIDETGFKYAVDIERSGSEGVGKMKVFCFDLMLLQFGVQQNSGVDFLIHDSVLYDGVDSRQRALALERASQIAQELGGQYICTLNSDMVPSDDFTKGFDFDAHVRLTLTDDKDSSGSLLGFRYERPGK